MVGEHGWNIHQWDVVTACLNPEVNDDDINMTLPEGWPGPLDAPAIVVRLKNALYGLKQAPRLCHNDINTLLLSLKLTPSQSDPNIYLCSDGILMLYVDDISMLYQDDATNAAIEVKARRSEKFKITNHGQACQFLSIQIHREENDTGTGTGISLGH